LRSVVSHKRVPLWRAVGLIGMSEEVLRRVYGHHDPDFMGEAADNQPWAARHSGAAGQVEHRPVTVKLMSGGW
jgi:hypothetical protein